MAIKEISSQSAIDHKRKRRTTLTYIVSLCFLFICIYLNMAIGSSKINFSDIIHYVTGHTDTKATFLLHNVRMPRMNCRVIYWRCISGIWFVNASNDTQSASIT